MYEFTTISSKVKNIGYSEISYTNEKYRKIFKGNILYYLKQSYYNISCLTLLLLDTKYTF